MSPRVAIVHDQLIQRGGAEGVLLEMADAFPDAPIYTSVYAPERTFPEFADRDVRALSDDALGLFRGDHRRALPLLAWVFTRSCIDADVVLCSSAGWSHGVRTTGRKLVYCNTPARWLYNFAEVRSDLDGPSRRIADLASPAFRRWDRWAASSADAYLANSANVSERIRSVYGWSAPVVHPPARLDAQGPRAAVPGLDPGFVLTVSRIQTYKNIASVLDTARRLPCERFVVAGDGPMLGELRRRRPPNVTLLGAVEDPTVRWLYDSASLLLAPAYEDFGLTPIEAATFAKPVVALDWGGHRETVLDGETGVLFPSPTAEAITAAIVRARATRWDHDSIVATSRRFDPGQFRAALRHHVDELAAGAPKAATATPGRAHAAATPTITPTTDPTITAMRRSMRREP